MFDLTRSQKQIQTAAREFARGEFDHDITLDHEEKRQFPLKIWKKAADLGFLGIQYPEIYSGGEMGVFEACLIAEAFCSVDSTLGIALSFAGIGSEAVCRFGDDALKEKVLSDICEGNLLSGIAFSESPHGLDAVSINTLAEFKQDRIVLNGKKSHVINRGENGAYLVLCRTDPREKDLSKALGMVWVKGDQKGICFTDAGLKFGANMMQDSDLCFEDVSLPVSSLVGISGRGIEQLEAFYNEIKLLTCAQALGIAQGALELSLSYIKQREQFNRKLAVFQVIRHKIASMATKIELSRLITYKAALEFDRGRADSSLISMAKMTACRTAVEVADDAIQLLGGYGYMKEYHVERYFRDAKITELSFGTTAAQRDIIGDIIIGRVK